MDPTAIVYVRGDSWIVCYRLAKTGVLFMSWICLGLFSELVGPTLPALKARIGADYEQMGRVLASRSAGLFIGSVLGGVLHDRFARRRDLIMMLSLIISGTTIILAPHVSTLWLVALLFHLMGNGHGLQTTGGNPSLQILWADRAAGPFNFLHAGFGLGAAISPLISAPFLEPDRAVNIFNATLNIMNRSGNMNFSDPAVFITDTSQIEVPYGITGALCYLVAIGFLIFSCLFNKTPSQFVPKEQKKLINICNPGTCAQGDKGFGCKLFVLIFFYYVGVVGCGRAYGKFVYTYCKESSLGFSTSQAAWLNTAFWISFTAARFVNFVSAQYVPIHIIQFVLLSGLTLAAVCLNIFHNSPLAFWIGTCAFGFCHAPLFPCGLGWINRYLQLTSTLITIVNVGSSTGGMFAQWMTGYFLEYYGPRSFLYIVLSLSILIVINFCIMHLIGHKHGDRFREANVVKHEIAEDTPMDATTKV